MSETSFDTSAADTLTSGLSLGQCIKNAAEEFQPSENWFELQPTIEKEWHTLQGEPSSRVTMLPDELSELPISNVSSRSIPRENAADQESVNPILRLLDHVKLSKPLQMKESSSLHQQAGPSSELCTPLITTRNKPTRSDARDDRLSDRFITPAMSKKSSAPGNTIEPHDLSFMPLPASTPTIPKTAYNPSSSSNENVLSAQNISDLLEKDDSLAQRVKDLLEEETSRSEASDHSGNRDLKNNVPALLQNIHKPKTKRPVNYKGCNASTSNPQSEIWQGERIVLSDTSLCSVSDKTIEAKVHNPATTLSLFSDGTEVIEAFNDQSSITGDTLISLNSSKGTEYGDLPDSVDIPHDIMSRLNNMRLIGQKSEKSGTSTSAPSRQAFTQGESLPPKTKYFSDVDPSTSGSLTEIEKHKVSDSKATIQKDRNSLSAVPISGDVQFYTGSNPTTPQCPFEEEKLQQLQTYIEKKTGVPTISPLVATAENASQAVSVQHSAPSSTDSLGKTQALDNNQQSLLSGSQATQNLVQEDQQKSELFESDHLQSKPTDDGKPATIFAWNRSSHPSGQESSQKLPTSLHRDEFRRSEPEGMSHPIANLVPASSSENNASTTSKPHTTQPSPIDVVTSKEASHLDESIADESLLARIKSALTDSFSQRPVSGSSFRQTATSEAKSDTSFASSIDSLAVQVKALLEEEIPQLINTDENPQDASNLSQVIQNFEHTDLWKFVAQFLPGAINDSVQMPPASSNVSFTSLPQENCSSLKPDESMTELTPENSFLDRLRTELRKSSSFEPQQSGNGRRQLTTPTIVQSSSKQNFHELSHSDIADHSVNQHPSVKISSQTSGLNDEGSKYSEMQNLDSVPGIPTFTPSVMYESSRSGDSSYEVKSLPSHNQQMVSPQKSFSHCRKNAKTVIASQLNRAAQRNFDVSLTPARHPALHMEDRNSTRKINVPPTFPLHGGPSEHNFRKSSWKAGTEKTYLKQFGDKAGKIIHRTYKRNTGTKFLSEAVDAWFRSEPSPPRSSYFMGSFELCESVEESPVTDVQRPDGRVSSQPVEPAKRNDSYDRFTPQLSIGIPIQARGNTSPRQNHRSAMSGSSVKSDASGRRHRYRNVPYPAQGSAASLPFTSGVMSSRVKTVSSGEFSRKADLPRKRVRYSDEISISPDKDATTRRSRSKSPMRDRTTVFDWLKSPEHKAALERSKHLPTFDEMMEEERRIEEMEIPHIEISEHPIKISPVSEKTKFSTRLDIPEKIKPLTEKYLKNTTEVEKITSLLKDTSGSQNKKKRKKNDSFLYTKSETFRQFIDITNSQSSEKLDERKAKSFAETQSSSTCPQIDADDSYQHASLHTAGLQTTMMGSSIKTEDNSDQDVQRRTINLTSSSDVATDVQNESRSKIPRSLSEFKSLDETVQHEVLKKILEWANKRRSSVTSNSKTDSAPEKKRVQRSKTPVYETSLGSTQAVCDSDSTEYCDLPSTRPPTAQTNTTNSQQFLGMDETKAEQVMKRLLKKIQQQKNHERKKPAHKRNVATSSTPQRSRPPLVAPEASSIASTTDTDVGGKYYVKFRDRKHQGQRKVAYIEEISESEPTVIKVKRRHRRPDGSSTGRVILYDRSVQTASSADAIQGLDVSTNFPSPVKRESRKKVSKAVQTASTQSSTSADQQDEGNLDDTIVIESHVTEDKENIDVNNVKAKSQRISSFYVDSQKRKGNKPPKQPAKVPVRRSMAWYEPFQYEPAWMPPTQKQNTHGLVRISLQEALVTQNPKFISKVRERQKRITINTEERRMQEIWAEERQRVFGGSQDNTRRRYNGPPIRRSLTMTKKQIVAETKQKYQQLPEVVQRKKDEERKKEYASHRLKAQLYKKKVQNKVLGRLFIN